MRNCHSIAEAIRRAALGIERFAEAKTAALGLTPRQLTVLLVLAAEPHLTATEVARRLGLAKETVASVVRRLAKEGLIKLKRAHPDAREKPLVMTRQGEGKIAKGGAVQEEIDAAVANAAAGAVRFMSKLKAIAELGRANG